MDMAAAIGLATCGDPAAIAHEMVAAGAPPKVAEKWAQNEFGKVVLAEATKAVKRGS